MTTAVVALNRELKVVFVNAAAEHLLQVSASHAYGQPLRELLLLNDEVQKALAGAIENQQPFTERDALLRLPDNISQHVDFTVNLVHEEPRAALVLELQPLNRLQRINKDDESVARQETARRLIRGLAHEIKNPLGGIRGAAQLLEQELNSDESLRTIFWSAASAAGHRNRFFRESHYITDDHMPFLAAGIPAIDLIDYVGNKEWHTPNDTLEHIDSGSLHMVGEVVMTALPGIEDTYMPPDGNLQLPGGR